MTLVPPVAGAAQLDAATGRRGMTDQRVSAIPVVAKGGRVTLGGALGGEDLIPVVVGLASGVDGVVAVVNQLTCQRADGGK